MVLRGSSAGFFLAHGKATELMNVHQDLIIYKHLNKGATVSFTDSVSPSKEAKRYLAMQDASVFTGEEIQTMWK